MAIKIDWQDLLKRYINWQEIVRVYKNRGEIRPNTVPPTPPVFDNYLCFTANTSGSTVQLTRNGDTRVVQLEISRDKNTWTSYTIGDTITLTNAWDKVYFRNTHNTWAFSRNDTTYYYFVMSGSISASGDITTLLYSESTTTLTTNYTFFNLFNHCSALTTAPELPATTLVSYCYENMFSHCTWLITAPSLPATTLVNSCYVAMFYNCTALTTAPSLPATTLAINCYAYMFDGCTSLNTLPQLPATTLSNRCYEGMFNGCTNINLYNQYDVTHPNEYRIPTSWTGTVGTNSMEDMLRWTWGNVTTPSINTTYYTSNTIV